jgi:predicted Zn-dependent protease
LTHPPAADRVVKVQEVVAETRAGGTATNAAEFERYLDGLIFGDSREKGIVRGSEFIHPILRFAIRFPQTWDVTNSNEQVTAQPGESSNIGMVLQLGSGTGPLQQLAPAQMSQAGWTQVSGQRTSINGLDAYVGTYQGVSGDTRVTVEAAHVRSGDQIYIIAGIAPSSTFNAASRTFSSAIQTFRSISRDEADRVQPSRIDFYTVRAGDTWESIARRAAEGGVKASSLAIMNGSDPGSRPRAGERIRIVVPG